MTILDEIQHEAWHILASTYTYQRMVESLVKAPNRYELANQLVALNALGEIIVIRVARLADKRRDARSVSMLLKRGSFPGREVDVETAANKFISLAQPVVKLRHEQIAHMKPGVLSSYPWDPLPDSAVRAIEALVNLIDVARGKAVGYKYKVGSQEAQIDLRASLSRGEFVPA